MAAPNSQSLYKCALLGILALVPLSENVGYARRHGQAIHDHAARAPGRAWSGSDEPLDQGRGPRGVHRDGRAVPGEGRGTGPRAAARQEAPGGCQDVDPALFWSGRGRKPRQRRSRGPQGGDRHPDRRITLPCRLIFPTTPPAHLRNAMKDDGWFYDKLTATWTADEAELVELWIEELTRDWHVRVIAPAGA
ncbi:MAG: hypothetical protein ACYCOU_13460 [Sulfobacillus sp.]